MRKIFLALLPVLMTLPALSQKNGTIKGVAYDTLARQSVGGVTITMMKKKDSSLVSFTMADNNGRFVISAIPNGEYRLLVTHVNYHNTNSFFTIDEAHKEIDLGKIYMNDLSHVLSEVIVRSEAPPVTLIGDTIQYNAGSFKTQPNANVEDLLKKLPGVKVEKDGTVKAQGEKVKKVLVDGKEFFGNDPKIATKNLPADAIDKVQVYDKLSDQAQMTGFDDGNSEKTINLKLKKDKKKGFFGKAMAGGGDNGRYESRFNLNSFKGARQMSAIGMGNNVNAEGFSFFDVLNFTGALSQLKNGGGDVNIQISDDDPIAGLLGGGNTGINTTFGGGFNYNNIIGTKTDFQSNYFYSRYNPVRESHIQRQYFSPANLYTQNAYSNKLNNNHRLNFTADYQIDSFHSIKISPSYSYQQSRSKSQSDYMTMSDQGFRTNDGVSNNSSNSEGYNLSTNILFRKKFRRRGRTFSLNLLTNLNNSNGDARLESLTNFYDQAGGFLFRDSINQVSNTESDLKGYNARAVYTEPIFKRSLLEFSAGKSNTNSTAAKNTFDYNSLNGKFDKPNHLLTNDFSNSYAYINGGFRIRKQTKKYNYAAGVSWQQADLEGKIVTSGKDSVIGKRFNNLLPTARFQYYFTRFRNLTLNYATTTNQPSITQLQPVPDNSNPLYVKQGNPDLKQEFSQVLRLNLSLVNPYKNRTFFTFLTVQQTQNKIVNYDKINSLGVDSVRYLNVNGALNLNGQISWSYPLRFLKGTVDLSSGISYSKGKQLYNDVLNQMAVNNINVLSVGPEARFDINPNDKLNLSLSAGVSYNKTTYSAAIARQSKYLNQEYSAGINWQLPKGFYFITDLDYRVNGQHIAGFNAKTPLWNASISKQMLHFSRGELKLSVNDLLDQNVGIYTSTNQNYIEDTRTKNLKRFFMLSFTYNLTKTGLSNNTGGGRVMIR
jgi:hypothetical protein